MIAEKQNKGPLASIGDERSNARNVHLSEIEFGKCTKTIDKPTRIKDKLFTSLEVKQGLP